MKGLNVCIQDRSHGAIVRASTRIRNALERLRAAGAVKEDIGTITSRVRATEEMDEAVSDADYVQESVYEDYDLKKRIFAQIDKHSRPEAIIASSSSGLLISRIQRAAKRPERCLIAHPWNPPYAMPLVEIVPGKRTSPEAVETTKKLMLELGRRPIVLRKEVKGHVGNRLAAALWLEAINLVTDGVVTIEDLDRAVTASIGLRWSIYGPFLSYHLGGGEGGIQYFIRHLGPAFAEWWRSMKLRTRIDRRTARLIGEQVEDYGLLKELGRYELERRRDTLLIELAEILAGIERQ